MEIYCVYIHPELYLDLSSYVSYPLLWYFMNIHGTWYDVSHPLSVMVIAVFTLQERVQDIIQSYHIPSCTMYASNISNPGMIPDEYAADPTQSSPTRTKWESVRQLKPRFKIPEKFRSKFRFRAIFRDFWSRSRWNQFFRYRSFPDFLIKKTEMWQ
jgi:hypothetical protein